jgi:hypothetical protein
VPAVMCDLFFNYRVGKFGEKEQACADVRKVGAGED